MSPETERSAAEDELQRLREEKLKRYQRVARIKQQGTEFPEQPVDADTEAAAALVKKYPTTLLEFWAAWCRPCVKMKSVTDELATEYWGDIAFVRVDLDRNPDARDRWGVTVLPTMVITRQGLEVARLHGAYSTPRLAKELEPFAAAPETKPTLAGHSHPPGERGG